MKCNVVFFGIRKHGKIVAAASAEMDRSWGCVEMTDFATLPEHQGKGDASKLLARMEKACRPGASIPPTPLHEQQALA